MQDHVTALLDRLFRAIEDRDLETALSTLDPDIDLFDPHYPKPQMNGHAQVRAGLEWGLSVMERFGFAARNTFLSEDGFGCAVEVDSNHRLRSGQNLSFPQVFVVECRNGLITRLRAYEPYGPNGIGGFFLGVERLKRRITGRQ